MKPRHGAISSTLLTLAGVLGLSAAGLSVVTGVTPCSLMSSCETEAAPVATTVAGACESKTEKAEEVTLVSDTKSDCSTAKDCSSEAKAVAVSDSDCSSKKDCDGAKAVTVAASSDCSTKTDCDGAKAVAVSDADCSSKAACDGAKAVAASDSDCESKSDCGSKATAVNASDCSSKSDCDKGEGVTLVNADGSDCSTKGDCGMKAVAASDSSDCAAECADGDVKALPVAVHAFNTACPYSGNEAKADIVADYNGMKVNFCCNGCKGRFEKADDETRAMKVAGVVKPINDTCCGKPADVATMAVVQGFPVAGCKPACADMVAAAPAEKQRAFVASHIKFVNENCCGTDTTKAKLVGFHNGKAVALCGDKCAEHFNKASAEKKDAWMAKMVSNKAGENCDEKACDGDKACGDEA